jgi:hypothetical protein
MDAPWYVPNTVIRRDLQTPTVKEEILRYSSQYSARLSAHDLVVNLVQQSDNRRLRRHLPNYLVALEVRLSTCIWEGLVWVLCRKLAILSEIFRGSSSVAPE